MQRNTTFIRLQWGLFFHSCLHAPSKSHHAVIPDPLDVGGWDRQAIDTTLSTAGVVRISRAFFLVSAVRQQRLHHASRSQLSEWQMTERRAAAYMLPRNAVSKGPVESCALQRQHCSATLQKREFIQFCGVLNCHATRLELICHLVGRLVLQVALQSASRHLQGDNQRKGRARGPHAASVVFATSPDNCFTKLSSLQSPRD